MIQENMWCHIRICKSMSVLFVTNVYFCIVCVCACDVFFVARWLFSRCPFYWCRQALFSYLSILLCASALHLKLCIVCYNVHFSCFAFRFFFSYHHSLLLHVVGCLKNEIYDNFMRVFLPTPFLSHTDWDLFLAILATIKRYILLLPFTLWNSLYSDIGLERAKNAYICCLHGWILLSSFETMLKICTQTKNKKHTQRICMETQA